jgi:hypothetical protein
VKTVDLLFDIQLSASLSIGSHCTNPLAFAPVPGATFRHCNRRQAVVATVMPDAQAVVATVMPDA